MIRSLSIVTDAWEPQINGVTRTLTSTVAELRSRGMTVEVFHPGLYRGIDVGYLSSGMKLALPPYGLTLDTDAVHVATEGPLGLAAKRLCDKLGLRYTTAYHTNFPYYFSENFYVPRGVCYRVMRWFHGSASSVMVPTRGMIDELERNGIHRCVEWGRGVDKVLFNPRRQDHDDVHGLTEHQYGPRPFWLNVGRVSGEKNLDAFLDLPLPGTKFVVGEGPVLSSLKRRFPETRFLGVRRGRELASVYRTANVFVFPSLFDTYGLVNAEAISCGTPVAAFPVNGPKDVVKNERTGALDQDLFRACIRALKMGRVWEDFSWERATDQFQSALVSK